MLCVIVFVYLISGSFGARWTQEEIDEGDRDAERFNYSCIIPPSDVVKNGRFTVEGYDDDEQPAAGKKAYSYVILFTCNPGFTKKGLYLVQCITDKGTDEFPECLPTCKSSAPDVWSCGSGFDAGEAKCLAPTRSSDDQISLRQRPQLQCGVTPQVWRTTVVNGREANREEVPWHAGVYTKTTRPYMQICGGTIVSDNVVVSAAHCFWTDVDARLPAANYAVAVGKLFRPWNDPNDPDVQKFDVQELRIPPRFRGSATNFQDDIALLILAAPFIKLSSFITPACLDFDFGFDTRQLAHGKLGRVSGWGLDSADGPSSQVLNVVELPAVSIEQCIASSEPSFLSSITSDKICAGYTNGTAVCKGDSGGGLVVPDVVDGATRYFLRGIVSTAPRSDHLCNIYAVATFTHVFRHEHFIMAGINQEPLPTEAPKISPITISPPILDNNTNSSNSSTDNDYYYNNPETSTEFHLTWDQFLTLEDTYENDPNVETTTILSPDLMKDLKKIFQKRKENQNHSTTLTPNHFGPDNPEDSLFLNADSTKIPVTNKTDPEPITNPPSKSSDNFAEYIDDKDIGINKDKVIGITKDQSFENVNTNNPITDESIKNTDVISNDNIAKTPASGVPIGISNGQTEETENSDQSPQNLITNKIKELTKASGTISNDNTNEKIGKTPALALPIELAIGQTDETVSSSQNINILPIDMAPSTDKSTLSTNTNDKKTPLESPIKPKDGQISQTANPEASSSSDIPMRAADTLKSKDKQVANKESSINDDTITIWPAKPVGSNQNPGSSNTGVQYTETPAVLEDYWVSAGWDCDHSYPGHYHHHWPHHHSWHKHPSGQNSQQNWHKHPTGQDKGSQHNWHKNPTGQGHGSQHNWHKHWESSEEDNHDWHKQPNWQSWKRFHPFTYHHGFTQQPSKSSSNYGAWFSKYRK